MDTFESRTAELKGDRRNEHWFLPLRLHILPKLGCMPVSEITQTEIRNILAPIWHTKAGTARTAESFLVRSCTNFIHILIPLVMCKINCFEMRESYVICDSHNMNNTKLSL
ncbi:hypothetical protein GGR08_001569 [Bartonella fuyuanensis]|uniref:Phage integrase central domain-containing protein n=1 Tax=Bartonella fuyuanensis TaxID=1460968 RepID=A0A840DW63_9HYPH|nr:hypothetical protein [Bartonella fuyuanensis]